MVSAAVIAADAAAALARADAGVRFVDCRFDLAAPAEGELAFLAGHIDGAVYAHLDRALADVSRAGHGRHPLPEARDFSRHLSRWGIAPETRVIAYDDGTGAFAARLWWLLTLAGHEAVAVLDGGFAAWRAAGLPVASAPTLPRPLARDVIFDASRIVDAASVERARCDPAFRLVDARLAPRFAGDLEPLDPVAGHIPGALNRPYTDNLDAHGRFKAPEILRGEFEALLDGAPAANLIAMCGSGVTACHHLVALAHAGLSGARLYADSWSGWIGDPARPVARGHP